MKFNHHERFKTYFFSLLINNCYGQSNVLIAELKDYFIWIKDECDISEGETFVKETLHYKYENEEIFPRVVMLFIFKVRN